MRHAGAARLRTFAAAWRTSRSWKEVEFRSWRKPDGCGVGKSANLSHQPGEVRMAPEIEVARAIAEIFSALDRLHREGASDASGSRVRREAVHFLWELREGAKLAASRPHSAAARERRKACATDGLEYDHSIPVACFMPELRRAATSPEAMLYALRTYVRPVILTSEEHGLLAASGLRAKMPASCAPSDPTARYRQAGIAFEEFALRR